MLQSNIKSNTDFPPKHHSRDEGVYLNDLAEGSVVEIETQHRNYRLVKDADMHVHISGHPTFCPEPVEVQVEGSIGGGSALLPEPGYIGRGMCLVFKHPRFDWVTTSRILEIHQLS